jgi:micrococcal nuclease
MTYKTLIKNLQKQLDQIEDYSRDDPDRVKILASVWSIGQRISNHVKDEGTTIKQIALDTGAPAGTLQKFVKFYKQFPYGYDTEYKGNPLSWSHYAAVLYVKNPEARKFYIQQTAIYQWSSHELRRRIRTSYYENNQSQDLIPFTKKLKLSDQRLYTYSAEVLKVVDGDTLLLNIDIGFKTKMEHKVRLRGINCAEAGTNKGEDAKCFVQSELQKSVPQDNHSALPTVIIQTYKAGKFGRYIVDVYYLPFEAEKERIVKEGLCLNQVLVDKKLAVIV